MPNEGSLGFTKGMAAIPPPPSLTTLGERATVAPRGWLHVIPLTATEVSLGCARIPMMARSKIAPL